METIVFSNNHNITLSKTDYKFDIVIPVGPNDIEQLKKQIVYTKKNIVGYRNIYIISYNLNLYMHICIYTCIYIYSENVKTLPVLMFVS
jgi:hypothetical protein